MISKVQRNNAGLLLSLKLADKGFKEKCMQCYDSDTGELYIKATLRDKKIKTLDCPMYWQVIDWFREVHNIDVHAYWEDTEMGWWGSSSKMVENANGPMIPNECFKSYYSALKYAITKTLELIPDK